MAFWSTEIQQRWGKRGESTNTAAYITEGQDKINLAHLGIAFIILGLGIITSCASFALEILISGRPVCQLKNTSREVELAISPNDANQEEPSNQFMLEESDTIEETVSNILLDDAFIRQLNQSINDVVVVTQEQHNINAT